MPHPVENPGPSGYSSAVISGKPYSERGHLAILLLAAALVAGCKASPTEAYERAKAAAEAKDEDALLANLTEKSATLLTRLGEVDKASGGRLRYIRNPLEIHRFGEVVGEDVNDTRAVLTVQERGQQQRVLLVFEDGAWRIEATELPDFWAPLRQR